MHMKIFPGPVKLEKMERTCALWGAGGGVRVGWGREIFSMYILVSEDRFLPRSSLLKPLLINFGDRGLACLAHGKGSLNICWLLNKLWLIFLSPSMEGELFLWLGQVSFSA